MQNVSPELIISMTSVFAERSRLVRCRSQNAQLCHTVHSQKTSAEHIGSRFLCRVCFTSCCSKNKGFLSELPNLFELEMLPFLKFQIVVSKRRIRYFPKRLTRTLLVNSDQFRQTNSMIVSVRMKPITDKSRVEINRFKKSVRTFGGMLEMKVRIDLREKGNVEEYYDGDVKVRKSEEERKLYILRATNGARVTIPKARLVSWLTVSLTANFELVAWAVHRRSIGSCSLHIDRKGEAIQYGEEGACLLPLLSDDLMNG